MQQSPALHLAIKDVRSNKIVGYSIDTRMKSRPVRSAIRNVVSERADLIRCVADVFVADARWRSKE